MGSMGLLAGSRSYGARIITARTVLARHRASHAASCAVRASRHASFMPPPPPTRTDSALPTGYQLRFGNSSYSHTTPLSRKTIDSTSPAAAPSASASTSTSSSFTSSSAASTPETASSSTLATTQPTVAAKEPTPTSDPPTFSSQDPPAASISIPIVRTPLAPHKLKTHFLLDKLSQDQRQSQSADDDYPGQPIHQGNTESSPPSGKEETRHLRRMYQNMEKAIRYKAKRSRKKVNTEEPKRSIEELIRAEEPEHIAKTETHQEEPSTSDVIHILGGNLQATYLAHLLAGVPNIPAVRFLLFNRHFAAKWKSEGQRVRVLRGGRSAPRNPIVGEMVRKPTYAMILNEAATGRTSLTRHESQMRIENQRPIRNLVVTESMVSCIGSIQRIKHRLDQHSTICLVQPGLGMVERLNELVFPDPATRPQFILAHMTHSLGYTNRPFTVEEITPGKMMLTLYTSPDELPSIEDAESSSDVEATDDALLEGEPERNVAPSVDNSLHFMYLMGIAPTLGAGFYHYGAFLLRKLADMISVSASETVATVLDLPLGNSIMHNGEARVVVEWLILEMVAVVQAMPETQNYAKLRDYVSSGRLQRQVLQNLHSHDANRPRSLIHRTLGSRNSSIEDGFFANRRNGRDGVNETYRQADERMRDTPCQMAVRTALGRRTDIQFLNGYFVRRGKELGIACPMNEMIIRMVQSRRLANRARLAERIEIDGRAGADAGLRGYSGVLPTLERDPPPSPPQPHVSAAGQFPWQNYDQGVRQHRDDNEEDLIDEEDLVDVQGDLEDGELPARKSSLP